jgi:hypothetical protein
LLALKVKGYHNVEISRVAGIRRADQFSGDGLVPPDGQGIFGVENRLLPVSVLGMRASAELDRLMACIERDVKP